MAAVRHLAFVISILTTHEEYLVVFTTVQNFVGIGALLSITCKC